MLWPSRKKRTAKKSTNRNSLVPNEGGFRPAGSVVFNELAIDLILNTSVNLGAVRQGQTGETSRYRSLTPVSQFSMSSIKRDVKKKVLPRPEAERIFVSRSSPLHCKSASRFEREVLLLSCLPFL